MDLHFRETCQTTYEIILPVFNMKCTLYLYSCAEKDNKKKEKVQISPFKFYLYPNSPLN